MRAILELVRILWSKNRVLVILFDYRRKDCESWEMSVLCVFFRLVLSYASFLAWQIIQRFTWVLKRKAYQYGLAFRHSKDKADVMLWDWLLVWPEWGIIPASQGSASQVLHQRHTWNSRAMLHDIQMVSPEPWKFGGRSHEMLCSAKWNWDWARLCLANPTGEAKNIGKASRKWIGINWLRGIIQFPIRLLTLPLNDHLWFSYIWYLELLTGNCMFSCFLRSFLESRVTLSSTTRQ